MNKFVKLILIVAGVLALIFLLLQIPAIAQPVSDLIKKPVEVVSNFAKTGLWISIGVILLIAGIKSMAVPVLAISLIIVGAGLLLFAVWPTIFGSKKPE